MVYRIDNISNVPSIESSDVRVRLNESEAQAIVNRYLETIREPKKAPASGGLFAQYSDIRDFFVLAQNVIASRQESEGVPENKRLLVMEEDPPESIDSESITFYLKKRLPGRFDQGPAGAGRIKESSPHQRAIVEHPEAPSQKLVTMGRFYDNWIVFNIYAKTNKVARERLVWFEQTMDIYDWYFRLFGFRAIEEGVDERERVKVDETTLTKYPVTYMVRSDDTFHFSTQELKKALVNVEVSRN